MEYLSIPHYRGLKEKYDEQKHGDGIFFTTDTHEIIANNATYGETIDTWSIADGVLTLTMTSGKTLKITFDEATESAKGFLSAEDKKKINALEGNFNKKVDKVPGKSLVDDTEIDKLSNFPNKADLDSAIADAKKAGTDTQTNLTAHIENKENPHEVTKVQVGLGNVTNDAQVKRSEMGTANGVATLGEDGLVPSSQLPSFVDDVLEFDLKDNFPTIGETGKIYVAKDSNLTYRWSGTQYVEISASLALGETSSTAYAGDKGKDVADKLAKVRNTPLSHIKDTGTFSATAEKVSLNYDCYEGDQYGAEATSHSVDIPVASETQAGIITAEDKKAITNLGDKLLTDADRALLDKVAGMFEEGQINVTYNSELDGSVATVEKLGGIAAGTTVAQLTGKTISKVLDALIFPTIQPTITAPSASLSLKSEVSNIKEVGDTGYTTKDFTSAFNQGAIKIGTSMQNPRAGAKSSDVIYAGSEANGIPAAVTAGTTNFYYKVQYAEGPVPLDSKGNPAASYTALPAGSVTSSAVATYGVYPFYANIENATPSKLPLTKNLTFTATLAAEGPNKHVFKLPHVVTKIEILNTLSNQYEVYALENFTTGTEEITVQGTNVNYNTYTRNDAGFNGETTYRITYSK